MVKSVSCMTSWDETVLGNKPGKDHL